MHITNFNDLKPSTKLRIPSINSETVEILNQSEPLVSQYYEPNFTMSEEKKDDLKQNNMPNDNQGHNRFGFRGLNFVKPQTKKRGFNNAIYPHFIKKNNDDTNKK